MYAVGLNPRGVAVDGKGRIWVACENSSEVYRIDPRREEVVAWPGFPGATSVGDGTGFAHARVVQPGLDPDGDGISSGVEISHACNPFDGTLPEIGRSSPSEGSVEGGAVLTLEGCGFTGLADPRVVVGGQETTGEQVVDGFFIETVLPAHTVGGLLDVELYDAMFD